MSGHGNAVKASLLRERDVLLISGPPVSGKTTLARLIAEAVCGKVVECSAEDLRGKFGRALAESPDVLIVEEIDIHHDAPRLKALAVNDNVQIELKGENSRVVPAPRFLIATHSDRYAPFIRLVYLRGRS